VTEIDPQAARDPFALFRAWYREAEQAGQELPEAMSLATATGSGQPGVRMVLLRGVTDTGFRFFTNYTSPKARALDANPRAALCFYWHPLERQVRVEGKVARLSWADSKAYFDTRPIGSRMGAWASDQSRPIESREELEDRVKAVAAKFEGQQPDLPPHWGGYEVTADRIEFWTGRQNRLHDRFVYTLMPDGDWDVTRLQP